MGGRDVTRARTRGRAVAGGRKVGRHKRSQWGLLPLLLVLIVIFLLLELLTGISVPSSPLLPQWP